MDRVPRLAITADTLARSDQKYDTLQRFKERGLEGAIKGMGILLVRRADVELAPLVGKYLLGRRTLIGAGLHSIVVEGDELGTVDKYIKAGDDAEADLARYEEHLTNAMNSFPDRIPETSISISRARLGLLPGPWIVQSQTAITGTDLFDRLAAGPPSDRLREEVNMLVNDTYRALDGPKHPLLDVIGSGNILVDADEALHIVDFTPAAMNPVNERRYGLRDDQEYKIMSKLVSLQAAIE